MHTELWWRILRLGAFGLLMGIGGCRQLYIADDPLYDEDVRQAFLNDTVTFTVDTTLIDYPLLSAAIFHETNRVREANGYQPLLYLPELEQVAEMHAQDMVQEKFFSHFNDQNPIKRTLFHRLRLVRLPQRYATENLVIVPARKHETRTLVPNAGGQVQMYSYVFNGTERHTYTTLARSVLEAWMASPTHRRNILDVNPRYLGAGCKQGEDVIGAMQFTCVQVFYK